MTLAPAVAACRRAVRALAEELGPGSRVLVACSGGADSLALLDATIFEGRSAGWYVVGATVDHGLQDGSAEQADRLVAQMVELGVAETVAVRVRVDPGGQGPEAAAREARYAVLAEVAERLDAAVVLLGHTLDDQAETVLLGLARGSGGRSLAGMRPGFDRFRRPFLGLTRAETAAACAAEGLDTWADPHNDDPRFLRARVRHSVLPVLEEQLGPGVTAALARTAEQLRVDMDYLDDLADDAWAALAGEYGAAELEALPVAVRRRVLRRAALAAGAPAGDLLFEHVLAVERLVVSWRGQKWVDLPGPVRVARRDGRLEFEGR